MRKEYIEDLDGEIWIQNNGYEISNKGRIITKQGKLSRARIVENEYVSANVTFEDGFHAGSVQRAVAYAFIPNDDPINKIEVNHKDGIKHHNWVENLEWCTKKENQNHACYTLGKRVGKDCYYSSLTEEQVLEIYQICKEGNMKYKDIAKMYNVVPSEISLIVGGKKWKNLNLEPLPRLIRGARGRSKQIIWINENKEYDSVKKCCDDLRNTYGIIVNRKEIKQICEGKLNEYKNQKFKYA